MKKKTAGIGAALLFLASKFKWLVVVLKLTKLSTLISMLITLGAYGLFFGWKFAVALVYLLFVHEMGHLVAARRKGIATSPAIFIPFMGAVIGMKELPKNAKDEAYIAFAGPLFGLLSFLPAIPLYFWTNDPLWGLIIGFGALLNLFNLFPVSPLDGGRIVTVLSTKIWLIGLIVLIPWMIYDGSAIMILIFIIGLTTWWARIKELYEQKQLQTELTVLNEVEEVFHEVDDKSPYLSLYEPIRSELMRRHLIQKAEEFGQKEFDYNQLLYTMKKRYIPFKDDKKKLQRDEYAYRVSAYSTAKNFLRQWSLGLTYWEEDTPFNWLDKEKKKVTERLTKLQTYYLTSTKEKILWLIAYLVLVGILTGFYVWGHDILESSRLLVG